MKRIKKNAPVHETVSFIMMTFLRIARENEAGIQADNDMEFLHDYRVSLRKARSALSLFKGVFDKEESDRIKLTLADIMSRTNRLRDLDVYLRERKRYFGFIPDSLHEGLNLMFSAFSEERRQELTRVVSMFESQTYRQTMDELAAQFAVTQRFRPGKYAHETTYDFACKLILRRYKKVGSIARHVDAETPAQEIHTLRIQCKKLRYLIGFFTPLFSEKSVTALLNVLKQLQDTLGRFNDFSVQQVFLQGFLEAYAEQHENNIPIAESIGALVTVLHQHQVAEHAQIMQKIAQFNGHEVREAFHSLFA